MKKVVFSSFISALLFMLFIIPSVQAAHNGITVALPVSQEITGLNDVSGVTVSYRLTPESKEYSMPEGSRENVYGFSLSGNLAHSALSITIDDIGEQSYILEAFSDDCQLAYSKARIVILTTDSDDGLCSQIAAYLPSGKKFDLNFHGTVQKDSHSVIVSVANSDNGIIQTGAAATCFVAALLILGFSALLFVYFRRENDEG